MYSPISLLTTALLFLTSASASTTCPGSYRYCITNFKLPTASAPGKNSSISFHLEDASAYLPDHPVNCSGKGPTDVDGLFKGNITCRPRPNGYVNFYGDFNDYTFFAQFQYKSDPVISYSEQSLKKKFFKKNATTGLVTYVGPGYFAQDYTVTH